MKRYIFVILVAALLAACGGGGGGSGGGGNPAPVVMQTCPDGSTIPATDTCPTIDPPVVMQTCPDGSTIPATDTCPTIDPPVVMQTCPDGSTIPATDTCPTIDPPVAMQTCPGGTTIPAADTCPAFARQGSPDSYYRASCTGSCYRDADGNLADITQSTGSVYSNGITFLHRRIEGPTDGDPAIEVPEPPQDVRQAWRDGWTGEDVDILVIDSFGVAGRIFLDDSGTHGYTVVMSALEIAPNAQFSALEAGLPGDGTTYRQGGVRGGTQSTQFDVINISFGLESLGRAPTTDEVTAEQSGSGFQDLLGVASAYLTNTGDAVIAFASGNEDADAGHYADAIALIDHDSTGPRVLIVGALDRYARATNPQSQTNISTNAQLADYSNHAGGNLAVQSRFLVEYGGTPYGETAFLCDAAVSSSIGCSNLQRLDTISPFLSGTLGTSFAAPRVAGFAALVRHKFPSLSGQQTASILLDTATTEGLACHTGEMRKSASCAPSDYGQGRVDIGRALAPTGVLR